MKSEHGLFRGRIDWPLVGAIVGLVLVGSVAMLSAASPLPYYSQILQRHFLALGAGTVLFVFGLGFNYQIFQDQSKTLYILALGLMVLVLLVGDVQRGTRGWLRSPYFSFQPSEFARIVMILVLAAYLDRRAKASSTVGYVLGAFGVVLPVLALILLEPDFSSALTFFPMLLVMLFCGGANIAHLLAMTAYGAVALFLPLLWTLLSLRPEWTASSATLGFFLRLREFDLPLLLTVAGIFFVVYIAWRLALQLRVHAPAPYFVVTAIILAVGLGSGALVDHQLKGYQRARFVAFLVPEVDPRGAAYNVQQAQIAIGSGGLWGKGVFSGTQSRLGFLPERHTDFIYAVIGEEMGFVGSMSVLALYMLLLWRVVNTARVARDRYGYLVCCGVAAISAFYLLVNVGMCLGLVPVAGVPLPLVSYGGSNLAVTLLSMGIVANIYSRRYAFY
ncbi:MAG: FtsW/RodA/SpoVE family cell cycle protein [Elusimicrobiota bacterium]